MSEITLTNSRPALILAAPGPLDEHPAAVYVGSLAQSSRPAMEGALNEIAALLIGTPDALLVRWGKVRYQHTQAIRAKLAGAYAHTTANKKLSALRGCLKQAWLLGQMTAEDYHKAVSVANVQGETLPAGRDMSAGEIAALLEACWSDNTFTGMRDAAIIAVLRATGMRRSELVKLDITDYDQQTGVLTVRGGKRNKAREVYLLNGASKALDDWLDISGDRGPLFVRITKAGKLTDDRLTSQAVYYILAERGKQAGVRDFTSHDFRRSFVSEHLELGTDMIIIAELTGHESTAMIKRYDRRPAEARRKAAARLHVPYKGK